MLRLLDLVYTVCTWNPERLEQIVDIPQIEEEIAEVGAWDPRGQCLDRDS